VGIHRDNPIRPALSYGSLVWSRVCDNQTIILKLKQVQRLGLLQIAPVRRSTATAALEIIYNIEPLDLFIREVAAKAFLRVEPKFTWIPTLNSCRSEDHIRLVHDMIPDSVLHAEKEAITSHMVWQRSYSVDLSTEGEDYTGEGHTCYTNGSLKEGHAGAGVAIFDPNKHCGYQLARYLGTRCSVYQAEVKAIQYACTWMISQNLQGQQIHIMVDNQAARKTLLSLEVYTKTAKEAITAANQLGSNNQLTFRWIKAYTGTSANEVADSLAKKGSESITHDSIHINIISLWRARWSKEKCRQTKLFYQITMNF
jgi:ribonuclease HI